MLILKALRDDNREDLLEALGQLNGQYAVEYMLEALVKPECEHGHTIQSVLDLIKGNWKDTKGDSSLGSAGPIPDSFVTNYELNRKLLALSHRLSTLEKLHHIKD